MWEGRFAQKNAHYVFLQFCTLTPKKWVVEMTSIRSNAMRCDSPAARCGWRGKVRRLPDSDARWRIIDGRRTMFNVMLNNEGWTLKRFCFNWTFPWRTLLFRISNWQLDDRTRLDLNKAGRWLSSYWTGHWLPRHECLSLLFSLACMPARLHACFLT